MKLVQILSMASSNNFVFPAGTSFHFGTLVFVADEEGYLAHRREFLKAFSQISFEMPTTIEIPSVSLGSRSHIGPSKDPLKELATQSRVILNLINDKLPGLGLECYNSSSESDHDCTDDDFGSDEDYPSRMRYPE